MEKNIAKRKNLHLIDKTETQKSYTKTIKNNIQ